MSNIITMLQRRIIIHTVTFLFSFIFLFGLLLPTTSSGQVRIDKIIYNKSIRIGISGNQPPFSIMSKNDHLIGFEIDLGKRLASGMGIQVEFVQLPFPELLPAMESNEVDIIMSGMTMTTTRNLKVAFIGPYITTGKSLLTKSTKYANIADVSELDSKKISIATLKGSTSEAFAKSYMPNAELVLVDDYQDAIDMVRSGEISLMLADYAECLYASLRFSGDNLQVLNRTMTNERIGIAIPSDDPLLINILQNFLGEIEASGELAEMESKWFHSGSWMLEVK